jgi:hypothetical protein
MGHKDTIFLINVNIKSGTESVIVIDIHVFECVRFHSTVSMYYHTNGSSEENPGGKRSGRLYYRTSEKRTEKGIL